MVALCRHALVLAWLLGLLAVSAFAEGSQGKVVGPITKMPGAYLVSFPAEAGIKPRDVVEIRRAGVTLGEALVVDAQPNGDHFNTWTATILPKAGVRGALSRGDVVVFLRHAVNAAAIPDGRPSEGTSYRAYSKRMRARLIQPYRSDDMIFEDEFIRVRFELLSSGWIGIDLKNKKDVPFTIRWAQSNMSVDGEKYLVLPREAASKRKAVTAVLGHDAMRDYVRPYSSTGEGARRNASDNVMYIDLHLALQYESGPKNRDFGFELAVVDRESFLGATVRPATEEEKDNLPPRYHDASVVTQVLPGSPAWKAGLVLGDEIVEVDGRAVESTQVFYNASDKKKPGQRLKMTVLRKGEVLEMEAIMAAAK